MSTMMTRMRAHIHPVVFPVSAVTIIAFVVFGAVFTDSAGVALDTVQTWIVETFGWFLILSVALLLVFCFYMVVGPYAKVRLGPDDSRPDYPYTTWFAMLFSAGMGIGLLFWGVAEPLMHFAEGPQVGSAEETAREAMILTYHHWGFGPWAVYAVLGLSLAYFGFRHNLPMTVRSALYPLIGDRIHGWAGNLVDVLAVFGTMFGVATSLGLGVAQINTGLSEVFGTPNEEWMQVLLIAGITAIATVSVFTGLDRGIRRLSQFNIVVAAALLGFVAVAGGLIMILTAYFENLGAYLSNFFSLLFAGGTYDNPDLWTGAEGWYDSAGGWLGDWTIFYWAWWISWSPFVGMFIARISRGRTIREFVLGVLLVPSMISFLWFTVMANTALELQISGAADLVGPTLEDSSLALFALLEQFPGGTFASVLAILVIVTFFVTSSDSGSFVIDMIASGGDLDPPRTQRVFWAVTEGLVAAVLLLAGGLGALQAGAVSTGLPFTAVLVVVAVGLLKGLRSEGNGVAMSQVPAEPLFGGEQLDDGVRAPVAGGAGDEARPPVRPRDADPAEGPDGAQN